MSRSAHWLLILLTLWASDAQRAQAETVALLEAPSLRPDLCAALRIQLTDVAEVHCEPGDASPSLSARLAAATSALARRGARLGVLLERDPDPRLVRMYIVGSQASTAIIALERIEDRPDADVDRSLALKVRAALEALIAAPVATDDDGPRALSRVLAEPPLRTTPRSTFSLLVEGGGLLSLGSSARWGGLFGVGARRARGTTYAELSALGRVFARTRIRTREGEVTQQSWDALLALRMGRALGWVALGGVLELGIERVSAHGRTRDDHGGSSVVVAPRTALGLDLRLALLRGASLRLSPMLEIHPVNHRFSLDGRVASELDRVRFNLPVMLSIALPLTRSSDAR